MNNTFDLQTENARRLMLEKAKGGRISVVFHGDCDGVSSGVIAASALERMGAAQVSLFWPDKGEQMRAFALAVGVGMFAIFALTWIALTIIGVQPAFLFALLAGFLEMIPLLGPILSAIPPAFAALVVAGPVKLLYVLLAFFAIQQLESHVIVPLVQSSSLKLHPISIIFAVLIMGGLFGIIGIFLAAPTVAVLKILYEELYLKPTEKDEEALKKRADEIVGHEDKGEVTE